MTASESWTAPEGWDDWLHSQREEWVFAAWQNDGSRVSVPERRYRARLWSEYLQTPAGRVAAEADGWAPAEVEFDREVDRELRRLRVREAAMQRFAEESAAEFATEWAGVLGSEFDPSTPEPVPCVLELGTGNGEYVLPPGVVFLFGARSTAKTWLAYEAIRQEAARGNPVLLLDYEMSYGEAMRRLYTLGLTRAEAERVVYVQPSAEISDAARAKLRERFAVTAPSLVVIDSVGMAMGAVGLDSNHDSEVSAWAFGLPLWLKTEWPGAVVLIIDHTTKNSGGESSDPIGSQRKAAFADLTVNVSLLSAITRTTRGSGRAKVRKDRRGFYEADKPIFDYEFGGDGPFTLVPADPNLISVNFGEEGIARVKIASYVKDHPGSTVEVVRTALAIQTGSFTAHKDALVAEEVIIHERRKGLFVGPRWKEWMDSQIVTDD